jgi:glycosyltransferase involved in cell wall biosynthesis
MKTSKAIVVLATARDGYQLPLALHESGQLDRLVTEAYWPADRRWFRPLGRRIPERLIEARYREGLPSERVDIVWSALAAAGWMRATRSGRLHAFADGRLGMRARDLALRHGAPLFSYSYYARTAFAGVGSSLPCRFIFQLHPHPRTIRRLIREELDRVPEAAQSLRAEHEMSISERQFEALAAEPHLANGWVVASSISARTLAEEGLPHAQIHVVPYGVNLEAFPERSAPPVRTGPLRAIFVGSLVQRKGLRDLLEAARQLGPTALELTICGRGGVDRQLLDSYRDVNARVRIGLGRSELVSQLHASEVFVLPSIAEGFAHVILEAMATGLPVVASTNTCSTDVVRDGVDGWTIPIRSPESIAEKLTWGLEHREDLAMMGRAAACRAREFTWERFRTGIRSAYAEMLSAAS